VREPVDRANATPPEATPELDEELERLPEKYREPLIAFHLQDRSQDETAALLGLSLSTVRRRLDAGRELLRSRLAARGLSLGAVASVSVPAALAEGTIASAAAIRAGAAVGPQLLSLVNEGLRMGTNYWKLGGLLAVAAIAVGVAVSSGEDKPNDVKEPKPDARRLIAAPGGLSKWATVKGRIVWPENGPGIPAVVVHADKEHCLSKGELTPDDVIVNKKNRGLKNVWVYLRPDSNARDAAFAEAQIPEALRKPKAVEHAVDQPCCQFIPRVLAVRVGDTIQFKNSSPIPHNVKYTSNTAAPEFNVTMPSGQSHTTPALKADLRPNSFECSIHPWMKGQLMVFDHPFYALTDADGNFEIKSVPAGKFRIVYRHELGYHKGKEGNLGFPIAIAGPTVELDPVTFSPPAK
jgi:plastocyanin